VALEGARFSAGPFFAGMRNPTFAAECATATSADAEAQYLRLISVTRKGSVLMSSLIAMLVRGRRCC
jgi:hypothetical protein